MLTQSTAGQVTGPSTELELVNYGAGYAWLRAERDGLDTAIAAADQLDRRATHLIGDERISLTDAGRRALAMANLFGSWPTVAEVGA
jgi:hypothetical protein